MRLGYTAIVVGGKYAIHILPFSTEFSRVTTRIKLEGKDDVLGVGDALDKTESEKLAALSALHQLNALGKARRFS
jgi:hypothetical protein